MICHYKIVKKLFVPLSFVRNIGIAHGDSKDLYHTEVGISYPMETICGVIQVFDTNHSLSGFVRYISCSKQDSDCKTNV